MTAAWFAKSKERSEFWLPIYEQIAQKNDVASQKAAAPSDRSS
jgi:hypothetical protein